MGASRDARGLSCKWLGRWYWVCMCLCAWTYVLLCPATILVLESTDAKYLAFMLHNVFWSAGQKKANVLCVHSVHSGVVHCDLCARPKQIKAKLGTRVPQPLQPMRTHLLVNDKLAQTPSLPPISNLVGREKNKKWGPWKAFHSQYYRDKSLKVSWILQRLLPTTPILFLPALVYWSY